MAPLFDKRVEFTLPAKFMILKMLLLAHVVICKLEDDVYARISPGAKEDER